MWVSHRGTGERPSTVGGQSSVKLPPFFCNLSSTSRIIRSVKTDLMGNGANSTILVARVNKSDSGNYSCSVSPDQFYTVTVHVLNGKWHCEISFRIYGIHKEPRPAEGAAPVCPLQAHKYPGQLTVHGARET